MTFNKGGFLQFQIVGKDHKRFEIDHILNIIGEQGFQRFMISGPLKLIPEQDRKIPINSL